jgi:ATP-dependent Clp protease protease subunit
MKIKIKGVIVSNDDKWVYEWFGIEAISPRDVEEQIDKAKGEELEIEINSGGGDVFAGSEIYTLLKEYKGTITSKIVGVAASAASVIAMAANKVLISPTAQIMIHNVSVYGASGDYRDLEHEAEVLKNYNVSIANAYQLKTDMKQDELLELMNKETWLNAQQAIDLKFADEVMFDEGRKLAAGLVNGMLPQEVINKVRNQVQASKTDEAVRKSKAKLNLLKLRGVTQ